MGTARSTRHNRVPDGREREEGEGGRWDDICARGRQSGDRWTGGKGQDTHDAPGEDEESDKGVLWS
jgi:hypothetical protein